MLCVFIGFQPARLTDTMERPIEQVLSVYPDKVRMMYPADQPAPPPEVHGLNLLENPAAHEETDSDG